MDHELCFNLLFKESEEKLQQFGPNTLISLIDVAPKNFSSSSSPTSPSPSPPPPSSYSSLLGATASLFESFNLLNYFHLI